MNASLPAALLVLLLSGTWLLGRRRVRPFLRSTDTSDVVALNRAQIERLREHRPAEPPVTASQVSPQASTTTGLFPLSSQALSASVRPRRQILMQLQAWLVGSRAQRLDAIATACRFQHRSVLPLLRRALRDPDPAVVAAAASAMETYRGRTAAGDPGGQVVGSTEPQPWRRRAQAGRAAVAPLPRNVSRTR